MSKEFKPIKRFTRKDQEHGVPWKGYGKGNSPARRVLPYIPLKISSWIRKENKGIPKK
jgi:hypothetical protein